MKDLKQYKAIYSKKMTCEQKDAVYIAKLKQPKDTELENVIEIDEKVSDLFSELAEMFNPNKK